MTRKTGTTKLVKALEARPEFQGDAAILRQGLAGAEGHDPMVHIAFQPADRATFVERAREALTAGHFDAEISVGSRRVGAHPADTIILYRNLPGGVAHIRSQALLALLDAGLIKSFTWEPTVRLANEPSKNPATPLSVIGDPEAERKLAEAGVSSALDLVSKATIGEGVRNLSRAIGRPPAQFETLVDRAREALTREERELLEHPPSRPFIPGIPMDRRPRAKGRGRLNLGGEE